MKNLRLIALSYICVVLTSCGSVSVNSSSSVHSHTDESSEIISGSQSSLDGTSERPSISYEKSQLSLNVTDYQDGYYSLTISAPTLSVIEDENDYLDGQIIFSSGVDSSDFSFHHVKHLRFESIGKILYIPIEFRSLASVTFDESIKELASGLFIEVGEASDRLDIHFEGDLPFIGEQTFYRNGRMTVIYHQENKKGFDCSFIEDIPVRLEGEAISVPDIPIADYSLLASKKARSMAKNIFENAIENEQKEFMLFPISDLSTYIEIKTLALELTKDLDSEEEKTHVLYNWVIQNIVYDDEYLMSPMSSIWKAKHAVCCGFTCILHDLLASIGIMSCYTSGYANYGSITVARLLQGVCESHAWLHVYVDGRVILMDPTWGSFAGGYYGDHSYDMSDEEVASRYITFDVDLISVIPEGFDPFLYHYLVVFMDESQDGIALYSIDCGVVTGGMNQTRNYTYYVDFIGGPSHKLLVSTLYKEENGSLSNWRYCLANGHAIPALEFLRYIHVEETVFDHHFAKDIREDLGDDYFFEEGCLFRIIVANEVEFITTLSLSSECLIPNEVKGYKTTVIGQEAFKDNRAIRSVTIPSNVKKIGMKAFISCTGLEEVHLSEGLEEIGFMAFQDCMTLKRIGLPNSLITIEGSAFAYCRDLEEVTIGSSLSTIGQFVFAYTPSLKNVAVNSGNRYFKVFNGVLYDTNQVTLYLYPAGKEGASFTCPSSLKTISFNAFHYNQYLQEIHLNDGLEDIEGLAFAHANISSITIPASVRFIGSQCFVYCENLVEVNILSSHISLEGDVFGATPFWDNTDLYVDGMLIAGKALVRCLSNDTNIILPEGPETITRLAFEDCPNFERVTISSTISEIGDYSFYGSQKLRTIVMSSSVKSIGCAAFEECYELQTIYFVGTKEEFARIKVDNEWEGNRFFLNANVVYCAEYPAFEHL